MKTILAIALLVAMLAIPTVVCAPEMMPWGWMNIPRGFDDPIVNENAIPNTLIEELDLDLWMPGFMEIGNANCMDAFSRQWGENYEIIPGTGVSEFAPPGHMAR
jgi:hypothetical protein